MSKSSSSVGFGVSGRTSPCPLSSCNSCVRSKEDDGSDGGGVSAGSLPVVGFLL